MRKRRVRRASSRHGCAAPLFAAVLAIGASTVPARELHGDGLGSTWTVKIADPPRLDPAELQRGIQQRIDAVAHDLSRWDNSSALSALNAATNDNWYAIPDTLSTTLAFALHLAHDTNGAYDPTIAPLVDIWGFGPQGRRYSPPSADELSAARARVGWSHIELDLANHRARKPASTQLDLSSMQHGFAADQVAAYLQSINVKRYLIDVGRELRASGDAPEGHPWHVAIERPPPELTAAADAIPTSGGTTASSAVTPSDAAPPMRVVALRDAGIATSGNYRYFFDYNGRRYSHRIDPRTGEPITHPLAAVTVIDPECMRADALATALTILGPDDGYDYAQRHGIAALFIIRTTQGLEERVTPAFERYLD
jgi:thiamine biosynthesis lipoprotein